MLASTAPHVELWWCELDQPAAETDRRATWLSADERARAGRFGADLLRQRYITGRATLRFLLGTLLGTAPAALQLQPGPRGRPEMAGQVAVDFNVSHTHGVALIGVAQRASSARIGVDVERLDRRIDADRLGLKLLTSQETLLQNALPADERRQQFLRYWTYKEAMSKATGDGLIAPFRELHVELADSPRLRSGPSPYVPEAWRLYAVSVPSGYCAALAVWASAGPSVV